MHILGQNLTMSRSKGGGGCSFLKDHIHKTSLAILYLISKVVSLVSKQNLNISKYVGLLGTLNENMSKKLLLHRLSISLNSINNVRLIVVL